MFHNSVTIDRSTSVIMALKEKKRNKKKNDSSKTKEAALISTADVRL